MLAPLAILLLAGCASTTDTTTATANAPEVAVNSALPSAPSPVAPTEAATTVTPTNATKYRVRGQVAEAPATQGESPTIVIAHEAIPDFMPAMKMQLPLGQDARATSLKAGDKIAFDLGRDNMEVSNVEKLPPDTNLKLADPTSNARAQ